MTAYGLKVLNGSATGKSVLTAGIDDLLLHSDYTMFKFWGDYKASVTFNPGDVTKTVSITHGLGYVPAFIGYGVREDDGAIFIIPSLPYGIDDFDYAECWADSDKIYFRFTLSTYVYDIVGTGYNGWNSWISAGTDYWDTYVNNFGRYEFGREGSTGINGYVRVAGVDVTSAETITSAKINLYTGFKTGDTSLHCRGNVYGLDEDNTGSFGDPTGRALTTAVTAVDRTVPANLGDYVEWDVTSQVNEIRARGGWSVNNAMGFALLEQNGDNDANFGSYSESLSYLKILKPGTLTVNFRVIVFKDKIA